MPISGTYFQRGKPARDIYALRLDLDGLYPQMLVSGPENNSTERWIAKPLAEGPVNIWSGPVIHPPVSLYRSVSIEVLPGSLRVTLNASSFSEVYTYDFFDTSFRELELVVAHEAECPITLRYDLNHPNHPANLDPSFSLASVFSSAGVKVSVDSQSPAIPAHNSAWTDAELHDQMTLAFPDDVPGWRMWCFFASHYSDNRNLGIMFETGSAKERFGAAVFAKSSSMDPAATELHPDAWRQRIAFFSTIHEIGHGFNLVHSTEKLLSSGWLPMQSGNDQLSFMNSPHMYKSSLWLRDNANNFFSDFRFRYSDEELQFLRHAPERFVMMGGVQYGHDHGLGPPADSPLELSLSVNRHPAEYALLEPVVIEVKVKNKSLKSFSLDRNILRHPDKLQISVQRRGGDHRMLKTIVRHWLPAEMEDLYPRESLLDSSFVSCGSNGWLINSPGYYSIRATLEFQNVFLQAELEIRVLPPKSWREEYVAQDFFSDAVARVLHVDGSYALSAANDVLQDIADRWPQSAAAVHANVALTLPRTRPFKQAPTARPADARAISRLKSTLGLGRAMRILAPSALGHIDYAFYVRRLLSAQEKDKVKSLKERATTRLTESGVPETTAKRVLNLI